MPRDTSYTEFALSDGRSRSARALEGTQSAGGPVDGLEANKLWYLKRINLFRALPESALERIAVLSRQDRVKRRELIFSPRDRGDAVYLLKEGRVKLSRFDETGREIVLAVLEEGEFFGEEALVGSEERHAHAEALEDGLVCRIERPDFEAILREFPDVAHEVARQIGERLLGAQKKLAALAFHDVRQRLAGALCQLAESHGEALPEPPGAVRLALRITHQELASLVASTRETVTSILNDFRREGLMTTRGREIVLLDVPQLQRRASEPRR